MQFACTEETYTYQHSLFATICPTLTCALQILKEFVGAYGPLAIMLEDLHHFDSISWSFLTTVAEKMSDQVLVVTTIRPNDGVLSVASRHEEGETEQQLLTKQRCQLSSHPHCTSPSLKTALLHMTYTANGPPCT